MTTNKWVLHVKKWSVDHKMAYGCAISDPDCKASYHGKSEPKVEPKPAKPAKPAKPKEKVCIIPDKKDVELIRKELFKRSKDLSKKIEGAKTAADSQKYLKESFKIRDELIKIDKGLKENK